jgi:ferric-dicitrate binding protein FerR (iron transport regulator)
MARADPESSVLHGATPAAPNADPVTLAVARSDRRVRRLLVLSLALVALVVAVLLAAGLVYPAAAIGGVGGLSLVGGTAMRLNPRSVH